MLDFRDIDISDRNHINRCLAVSDFMGCEYTFANNMAWRRLADSKIAFYKDFYIVCSHTEQNTPYFVMPSGSGDYTELFGELKQYTDSVGVPLTVTGVTEKSLSLFSELFPDSYTIGYDRDSSDYIYLARDLIHLDGKKYHSKRNHLKHFSRYDYEFSVITEKDFDDCIYFCTMDYNGRPHNHSSVAEQYAVNTYFTYFQEMGLTGGVIRIDGKVTAVTIGERLNSDTFCVHIEKADKSFDGIYPAINNMFVTSVCSGYRYVNREEDLGIEGLRRSKLSYYPAFLLDKYVIKFK
ncbi:MAG: phosphatidylglycerol lysyltransferase domain-containing protein [Ruminococcus sp.]|nr:phosphatidylglycerol lysyltransferase domain-containing protein [Ruminococcus sp.]